MTPQYLLIKETQKTFVNAPVGGAFSRNRDALLVDQNSLAEGTPLVGLGNSEDLRQSAASWRILQVREFTCKPGMVREKKLAKLRLVALQPGVRHYICRL